MSFEQQNYIVRTLIGFCDIQHTCIYILKGSIVLRKCDEARESEIDMYCNIYSALL